MLLCCGWRWDDIPCSPCCRAGAQGNFAAAWSATRRGSADHSGAGVGLVRGWCGAGRGCDKDPSPTPDEPLCSPAAPTTAKDKESKDRESLSGESWRTGKDRDVPGMGPLGHSMSRAGSASCPTLVSADLSPSPAPASPQSSQHERGWSRPRSHSPRGRLLLPPFLPRPNLPLCWPTSKKHVAVLGCPGPLRCPSASTVLMAGPGVGLATLSLAVPLHTSAVPQAQ